MNNDLNCDAKLIAEAIFPTDWKSPSSNPDFKVDQNAGRRHCAEAVAAHFIRVLQKDQTARAVMFAFFRREHGREPTDDEAKRLQCHMATALLAAEFAMREPTAEGCEHEYGLRLCGPCSDSINSSEMELEILELKKLAVRVFLGKPTSRDINNCICLQSEIDA